MLKMLRNDATTKSPAEIATGVKMTADHRLAQQNHDRLRTEHDAVRNEKRALIAANGDQRHNQKILELEAQEGKLNWERLEAKGALATHRAERASRVTVALADRRRDACARILETLNTLRDDLIDLDAIEHACQTAGAEPTGCPHMQYVAPIEAYASRFK